jgi:hypothetical protein
MVAHSAVRTDEANKRQAAYEDWLKDTDTATLVAEFISYLDYTEESDSGRVFHPIGISSCRVVISPMIDLLLKELRKRGDGHETYKQSY